MLCQCVFRRISTPTLVVVREGLQYSLPLPSARRPAAHRMLRTYVFPAPLCAGCVTVPKVPRCRRMDWLVTTSLWVCGDGGRPLSITLSREFELIPANRIPVRASCHLRKP